jgi:hypothetical protein
MGRGRWHARLCLAALVSVTALSTQAALAAPPTLDTLTLPNPGPGIEELGGPWEFKTGDNLAWAAPGFDDSSWETIAVDRPWGVQGHPNYRGFAWYRRHIAFTPGSGTQTQLALLLGTVDNAYEVYWNGRLVGASGKLPPHPVWYTDTAAQTFTLGPTQPGVLAIRVWSMPEDFGSKLNEGGLYQPPLIGAPTAIALQVANLDDADLRGTRYISGLHLLYLLVSVLGFVAWLRNRSQRLLLLTALQTLAVVLQYIVVFQLDSVLSFRLQYALVALVFAFVDVSLWFLVLTLLGLDKRPTVMRWALALAAVTVFFDFADALLQAFDWTGGHARLLLALDALFTLPNVLAELFPLALVALAIRTRLSLANWLIAISVTIGGLTLFMVNISGLGTIYTHWNGARILLAPWFVIGGNAFTIVTISQTCFFLALVYAVYRHMVEQTQRQGVLEQEFLSAQEVQRILIPDVLPALDGYAITSAYRPAQQVGGDFFQVIALREGAALVVLGDVSGKGLKAAMTVSLIIGAVRTMVEISQAPAEILAGLNRRLFGRMSSGFATCLVLRLDADGECLLANAGHLPPFLNGAEIGLTGSLPLGLDADAEYPGSTLRLRVGDRLTLYTDGLLEARNAERQLFGFERVKALVATAPDAAQAVAAAVDFGQDDDITVLTVTRLASGVVASMSLVAPVLA